MGILAKALGPPTAHALKKTDLYADLKDRIDGAMLPGDLAVVEAWLDANDHAYPAGWRDAFENMLVLKREEIDNEDVGSILKAKWDF